VVTPARLPRRSAYQASLARGDYFVLRVLKDFFDRAIPRWVRPGTSVLDVGCGEQPLRPVVERAGGQYTGADVGQNLAGTVDVIADITDVPLPDNFFDVVLCTEVLEHIADTSAALTQLARLCRPGGVIIVTSPFMYPLHEEPHDFVRLTPHTFRRLAEEHGLIVAELTTGGNELEVMATVWCNLWARRGDSRSRLGSAWNAAMRLPVNLVVLGLTAVLHSHLPRKSFLTTCCILRKPA
jgi:SAM-dependent methyltransferase